MSLNVEKLNWKAGRLYFISPEMSFNALNPQQPPGWDSSQLWFIFTATELGSRSYKVNSMSLFFLLCYILWKLYVGVGNWLHHLFPILLVEQKANWRSIFIGQGERFLQELSSAKSLQKSVEGGEKGMLNSIMFLGASYTLFVNRMDSEPKITDNFFRHWQWSAQESYKTMILCIHIMMKERRISKWHRTANVMRKNTKSS